MNITYRWVGDYLIPDLVEAGPARHSIGHYGRMRRLFLQEYRPILFSLLVLNGTLYDHLIETDNAARLRMELISSELAKQAGVMEQLKAAEHMEWVQRMNVCKAKRKKSSSRKSSTHN